MDLMNMTFNPMNNQYARAMEEAQESRSMILTGHHASKQFEILKKYIQSFEYSIDDNFQVGVMLASFGSSVTMLVESIGYDDPSLIIFYGKVNGQDATLIQNVNQLNFLLTALPREEPEKPKARIGFNAG